MHRRTLVLTLVAVALAVAATWTWPGGTAPPGRDEPTRASPAGVPPPVAQADAAVPNERAAASAAGPIDAPGGNEADAPDTLVRGVVVDAATRSAIAGADVAPERPRGAAIRTDVSGRFELWVRVDEAGATVVADAATHVATTVPILPADVADGAVDLQIELWPDASAGRITGRVVDETGRAVSDAELRTDGGHEEPRAALPPTRCDAEGRFVLAPLPPGRHDLIVEAGPFDVWRRDGVDLEPGQALDLGTIVLRRFAWGTITGRVVDAGGAPIDGADVSARTERETRAMQRTRSGPDGRFVLERVAPGSVVLNVSRRGAWSAWRTFDLAANERSTQDVRVPRGPHFVGGSLWVGGRPAPGFVVEATLTDRALAGTGVDLLQVETRTDADGRFHVAGLVTGPVDLTFSRPRPWQNENVEAVAVDRIDHRFEFDDVTHPLVVEGTVRTPDGRPLAEVLVGPGDAHRARERDTTDVAGRYRIEMTASAHSGQVLRALLPGYLPATHGIGTSTNEAVAVVDFVLTPRERAADLTVLVTSAGRPVPRATVILRPADDGGNGNGYGVSDSFGACRLGLAPGAWRLFVRHPDFGPEQQTLQLDAGPREHGVELTARTRHRRTVELRTAGDVPLAGELVMAWQRGAFVDEARTDALGRVRFDALPAGEIEFSAAPPGHARHELRVAVDGDHEEPLVLRVTPGLLSISGQVLRPDGTPAARAEVHCTFPHGTLGVATYTTADGDGRFTLTDLPPGDFALQAWFGWVTVGGRATAGATNVLLQAP